MRGGPGRPERREPTAEEWVRTVEFLEVNAPRRLALFRQAMQEWQERQDLPVSEDGVIDTTQPLPPSLRVSRSRIFGRVHMLMELQEHNPRMFEVALEQFQLEDQIIGALYDARQAREADDTEAFEQARDRAQRLIREYIRHALAERENRIHSLKAEVEREEQRLQRDRENFERLVEHLHERFERSLPGPPPEGD